MPLYIVMLLCCSHARTQLNSISLLFFSLRSFFIHLQLTAVGPFTFTYNRGHGECKNPVSNIESCTEDSRLLLNLQACPDVAGTESTGLCQ